MPDIYPPGGNPSFPAFLVNSPSGIKDDSKWPWPATGWNSYQGQGADDPKFAKDFKYYLYDDGPMDMRAAEDCMRVRVGCGVWGVLMRASFRVC